MKYCKGMFDRVYPYPGRFDKSYRRFGYGTDALLNSPNCRVGRIRERALSNTLPSPPWKYRFDFRKHVHRTSLTPHTMPPYLALSTSRRRYPRLPTAGSTGSFSAACSSSSTGFAAVTIDKPPQAPFPLMPFPRP